MTNLPFRNEQFIIGDLVIPNPVYHNDMDIIGVVVDIIEDWSLTLIVHWQTPVTDKHGKTVWEEKMPHYMYKRVA